MSNLNRYASVALNSVKRAIFGVDYKHKIEHMTFEMTSLCNSKCDMCHIWANTDNSAELSTEQILNFFKDPALKNLKDVILTGGEMFLRDDIPIIIKAIWNINKNINIATSSNGMLAEKIIKNAEEIAKNGIPVTYGFSLDGIGELHDKRRRVPGNFETIDKILIPGLKQLAIRFPGLIKIGIGHCLDDYGINTFDGVKKYTEDNNLSFITQLIEDFDYYLPEKKQNKERNNWQAIHFQKLGFVGKNRILKKDIYENADKFKAKISELPPTVHHLRLGNVLSGTESKYECTSMRNFFLLKYDGAITPCLRFSTQELGNIKEDSLTNILNSSSRSEAVSEILKCEGCLNTWCTDWSMEKNAFPFKNEIAEWAIKKLLRK